MFLFKRSILILLLLSGSLLCPAQKINEPENHSLTTVSVGVHLLNIQQLNMETGQYAIDCYLMLRCSSSSGLDHFEVMNGKLKALTFEGTLQGNPNTASYRIQAILHKKFNFFQFPFDHHQLDLVLEDKARDAQHLVYKVDAATTSIDQYFSINGWHFSPKWSARVVKHYYPVFHQTFSRYVFDIDIMRPWLSSFLKFLLPAIMFFFAGSLSLFMKSHQTGERLSLAATAMVGSVVFHLAVNSTLPPHGYLTYFDSFMIISYISLLSTLIAPVASNTFHHNGNVDTALKINRVFQISVLSGWLGLQALNAFWFF